MSADEKSRSALPPRGLVRLAQRDIGKVAKLFRDSGFRYRVFDADTGEHQVIDPTAPLSPMDHVPPVWPPPLAEGGGKPVAVTPPIRRPLPNPQQSTWAQRAVAETDRVFRAAALGGKTESATTAAPEVAPKLPERQPVRSEQPPQAPTPTSRAAIPSSATPKLPTSPKPPTSPISPTPTSSISPTPTSPTSPISPTSPTRPTSPAAGTVLGALLRGPAQPPKRADGSAADVLRRLLQRTPK